MNIFGEYQKHVDNAEEYVHNYLVKIRKFIPFIAKILLLSTYIEDGIRMYYQFKPQLEYFEYIWSCNWFVAAFIVLINLFCQIIPSILIIFKKYEVPSIFVLAFTVVFQVFIFLI